MDMKKLLAVSLTIMILGTLGGCGKQDTQEPPKVKIDYGNSELYTQEDMDAAIQVIEAEFATWEGCELHSLAYGGDAACSDENIVFYTESPIFPPVPELSQEFQPVPDYRIHQICEESILHAHTGSLRFFFL